MVAKERRDCGAQPGWGSGGCRAVGQRAGGRGQLRGHGQGTTQPGGAAAAGAQLARGPPRPGLQGGVYESAVMGARRA